MKSEKASTMISKKELAKAKAYQKKLKKDKKD